MVIEAFISTKTSAPIFASPRCGSDFILDIDELRAVLCQLFEEGLIAYAC